MANLVINKSLQPRILELLHELPQGLLIYGDLGMGLGMIAHHISGSQARVLQPLNRQGDVDFDTGTISVESIRMLYEQTRSKSTSSQVVIIKSADLMSIGAQNAFLKLLEEPTSSVRFILTTHYKERILPTILSRVQSLHIPPISESQSRLLLSKAGLDESEHARAMFLASGRPGLLNRLATDSELRKNMAKVMIDARGFITTPRSYKSLVIALSYSKSRREAELFIDAIIAVLRHTIYNAPHADALLRFEQVESAKINLAANANPKLQLIRLVVK